jgi:hypothetical protein
MQNQRLGTSQLKVLLKMNNLTKKNYIFFSKDGFTYDKSHNQTNNMQILGSGMGKNLNEAFKDFKKNQSYLLTLDYEDVIAVQTISEFITDLKLKGDK